MFGPTVNLCSKLNGAANPNSLVIGGDLHQIVRTMKSYEFTTIGQYMLGLKLNYPAYSVRRAESRKWYTYVI
jgi:class 3 adenylate cyclase